MKRRAFLVGIAIMLVISLSAAGQATAKNLTVTALVDGRDLLYITPTSVHWHHLDWVAVGLYGGNYPTSLFTDNCGPSPQHVSWIPDWPCPADNPGCVFLSVDSSTVQLLTPLPAQYKVKGIKVKQSPGGGYVGIYQHPTASNGYTTIIDFNDDPLGGPHWYTVWLGFGEIPGGTSEPLPVGLGPGYPSAAPDGLVTIYSNLSAVNSVFDSKRGWSVTGLNSLVLEHAEVGTAFTPTGNYTITQIQLALSYATGKNRATVGLYADNNGVPGDPIQRWSVTNLPADGTCCGLTTIDVAEGIPVNAGTRYWLVVRQPPNDAWAVWNMNTTAATGPSATRITHYKWANEGDQPQGGFAVYGK